MLLWCGLAVVGGWPGQQAFFRHSSSFVSNVELFKTRTSTLSKKLFSGSFSLIVLKKKKEEKVKMTKKNFHCRRKFMRQFYMSKKKSKKKPAGQWIGSGLVLGRRTKNLNLKFP